MQNRVCCRIEFGRLVFEAAYRRCHQTLAPTISPISHAIHPNQAPPTPFHPLPFPFLKCQFFQQTPFLQPENVAASECLLILKRQLLDHESILKDMNTRMAGGRLFLQMMCRIEFKINCDSCQQINCCFRSRYTSKALQPRAGSAIEEN